MYPRITGANIDYLYNRDSNTKNFYQDGHYYPSYGTSIQFMNRIGAIRGRDNIESRYPVGLNSHSAKVNLLMEDITEGEAGAIVSALNNILAEDGTGKGYLAMTHDNATPMSSESVPSMYLNLEGGSNYIYNDINGLMIEDYQISHKSNFLYDLSVSLKTNAKSAYLNYWGAHVYSGDIAYWDTGIAYLENDIVFYPAFENARDNFFYCKGDHTSSTTNAPTRDSTIWTQEFSWTPSNEASTSNGDQINLENFKEGMLNRIKMNKNQQSIETSLFFPNRSNRETRAILHFLENRMGYKAFDFTISGIYRSKKRFTSPEWEHEFVYFDVNNVRVTFSEETRIASNKELNTSNFWNAL